MSNYIALRQKSVRIKDTHKAIALKDFAKKKHVHERTVFYWLRRRKCRGYKTGGRWFIYDD